MNIQDEMDRIFKMQKDNLDNERKFKELADAERKAQVLIKVKEYLELNIKDNDHSDIQADSKNLLFWIENWENEDDT